MDRELAAVILAAGRGTRMKSRLPKVLHRVLGRTMLERVVSAAQGAGIARPLVVVGQGSSEITTVLSGVEIIHQEEQLGTGHAVLVSAPYLEGKEADVVILYGDTPLLEAEDIIALVNEHRDTSASVTLVTALAEDPTGYGRVIRDESGEVRDVVEHLDASEAQLAVREVVAGALCFNCKDLFPALRRLTPDNVKAEYQLPKVVTLMARESRKVAAVRASEPERVLGVNSRRDLARAEGMARERVAERLLDAGVTLVDPQAVYIDERARVGQDTVIGPFSILEGNTIIGEGCTIGPGAHLRDATVGKRVVICQSVVEHSVIHDDARIGPYAHVRPGCVIGAQVQVGNFAEVKNASVGEGSKIHHHSYVGDALLGEGVNVGAGVITVNYDGAKKHRTVVEDGAFLGCNSNLVAPLTIGKGAYVAAGSTISTDVPSGALGIERSRQENKRGWVEKNRALPEEQKGEEG
ncbi:MAG: bifunctional UDP-N-acetylglucosamine diphosphorylase/glucosamine-1-phosphate N-acetyltransferase GlmU [Bacillota bacterium]